MLSEQDSPNGPLWLFLLGLVFAVGCGKVDRTYHQKGPVEQVKLGPLSHLPRESHPRMISVLRRIAEEAGDKQRELGVELTEDGRRLLASEASADATFGFFQQGVKYLRLNELRQGITDLEESNRLAIEIGAPRCDLNQIRFNLGVANLRLAETENCCASNNSDSCILPIRGEGVHQRQEGSRAAVRYFLDILEHPSGLEEQQYAIETPAMWLLNLAAMTLGEYPELVPVQFRCPEESFQSTEEFPRFRNVLPDLQLSTHNLCGGAIADDFDNDGLVDIFTTTFDTLGQSLMFRNTSSDSLVDRTSPAGLRGIFGGLNAVQADYDNDGFTDIFIVRGAWKNEDGKHPNSLLRNNGDGTFSDVTFDAGLATVWAPTKTADWADYDNDGDVDLFIGNETRPEASAASELYRNNSDGTFTDVATSAGVDVRVFVMGAVFGDYDHDQFPDLFVSNGSGDGSNLLFHNQRDGSFENVSQSANVEQPAASFATWFWDYNNDGNLDLFVTNSIEDVGVLSAHRMNQPVPDGLEPMGLYRGDGQGHFQNMAISQGLDIPSRPMGANFGDLNGDGFLEFYLATGDVPFEFVVPNLMFLNDHGDGFKDITMAGGFGHLQKGHGVSFTDLNNDGMTDVYVQLGGAFAGDAANDALFLNPGNDTQWVVLKLVGTSSNRSAMGSRLHAVIREDGVQRSIYRHIDSGGSFGANSLCVTLGVGNAAQIDRLEIEWPESRQTQVLTNLSVGRAYTIVEQQPMREVLLPAVAVDFKSSP